MSRPFAFIWYERLKGKKDNRKILLLFCKNSNIIFRKIWNKKQKLVDENTKIELSSGLSDRKLINEIEKQWKPFTKAQISKKMSFYEEKHIKSFQANTMPKRSSMKSF